MRLLKRRTTLGSKFPRVVLNPRSGFSIVIEITDNQLLLDSYFDLYPELKEQISIVREGDTVRIDIFHEAMGGNSVSIQVYAASINHLCGRPPLVFS